MSVKLWEKDGRNIRLTQSGELLLQTAHQVPDMVLDIINKF